MSEQRWCPKCREWTVLVDRGVCPWCDTPLERKRRAGWPRPDLRGSKFTDVQLRTLYRAHVEQGRSINSLSKQVYERVGYSSHHSAAAAISHGWRRLRLPARDRIEATRLASRTHGRGARDRDEKAYREWRKAQLGWNSQQGPGRPQCKGVKVNAPGKGRLCTRHALVGSEYCYSHDPRRELERQVATAQMRRRSPQKPMLLAGPFVAWLHVLHTEHGSWRRVADLIG
ncbi:MAG TPA: hypothetical protein VK631_25105, partial [Solirubrobacteraceae bacterium]|nr:hypothetical protein [Solirubrobacteraceae bacterium]